MKSKHNFFKILTNSLLIILILTVVFATGAGELAARPGGGHSYSGGGGGGVSGGGGDGGGLIIFLILQLPPQISIPLIIGIFIFRFVVQKRKKNKSGTVSSSPPISSRIKHAKQTDHSIENLKKYDPNFSEIVFLDFVSSLYHKYYSYFGKPEFKNIAPFVAKHEAEQSKATGINQEIREIVIGSLDIKNINIQSQYTSVTVEIRANYSLFKNGKKSRLAVTERWSFKRKSNLLSPEPESMRRLTCPSCGGSSDFSDNGTCSYCGTQIEAGEKQWFLQKRSILRSEMFSTAGLAHYEQERGTNLPTVYQPGLNSALTGIANRAGKSNDEWKQYFFKETVASYFHEIYKAWSENNLQKARNLLSDRTYESFEFWMNAYRQAGLNNRLDNVNISTVKLAKIDTDKFYDAVTVRIFASAMDYVSDSNGKVIGGSARTAREFSEYWTFVKSIKSKTENFDHSKCPSCGAPADGIGQAGICEYCNSKISTGEFSWVLAIITQDEEYTG